jgi:hypothetical protein
MTNRERLQDAGILDPNKTLTNGQYEAIEDLYEWEVDRLISIKDKLEDLTENDPGGPLHPGIDTVPPLEEQEP